MHMHKKKTELVLIYNIVDIMCMYEQIICNRCVSCSNSEQIYCLTHWKTLAEEILYHNVNMS